MGLVQRHLLLVALLVVALGWTLVLGATWLDVLRAPAAEPGALWALAAATTALAVFLVAMLAFLLRGVLLARGLRPVAAAPDDGPEHVRRAAAALAAAAAGTPYEVRRNRRAVEVRADLADATWLALPAVRRETVSQSILVLPREDGTWTTLDAWTDVAWRTGPDGALRPSFSGRARAESGRTWRYQRRVVRSAVGSDVDYTADSRVMSRWVDGALRDAGFAVPSGYATLDVQAKGALWFAGTVAVLLVVGFAAWGATALVG